jgi:dienelactone hydrolase
MTPRRRILVLVLVAIMGVMAWVAKPYVDGLALVVDLSGREFAWRQWLPVRVLPVDREDIAVPTRHGTVTGRLYRPSGIAGPTARTILVIPGLHTGGVDEPRLDRLTRRLAATGLTVVSLPLPDLRQLRVVPRSTDMIEDAALWLTNQPTITRDQHISFVGISFGGGLTLVAAGRPSLEGRVDMVMSFGGHGNLPRVINYLCTGVLPDGTAQPAHDYGAAILLLAAIPHLVPPDQAPALEHTVRTFLEASMVDVSDPPRSAVLFAEAVRLGALLPEPARGIMADVSSRDVTRLGPRLLPLAEVVGGDAGLSAERSPVTTARIFLLHGTPDTIIPQSETPALATFYDQAPTRRGHPVDWLLTPALSHADAANAVSAADVWALVRFWTRMLG